METTLYGTRDIIPTCARLRSGYVHLAEGPKSFEEFRLCTHEREADGTPVDHPLHAQLGTNVTVVPIRLISTDPSVNCSQALVSHDDKGRVVCRADAAGQPYTRHDGAKGCCEGPAQCAFAKEYGCSTETRLVFALKVGDEELVTSFVTHASSAADEIPRMIRMASVTAGTTPARAIQLTLRKLPRLTDNGMEAYCAPTITLADCSKLSNDEIRVLRQEGNGVRKLHAVQGQARNVHSIGDESQRSAANECPQPAMEMPAIMSRMTGQQAAPTPAPATSLAGLQFPVATRPGQSAVHVSTPAPIEPLPMALDSGLLHDSPPSIDQEATARCHSGAPDNPPHTAPVDLSFLNPA